MNPKSKIGNLKWVGLSVIAFVLAVGVAAARAQQPAKIPMIGYVTGSVRTATSLDPTRQAFRQRLKELGYIEGKNITIEYRYTEGKGPTVEAEQARDLVRLNVDVLIVSAYPSIRAAKEATKTIPVVMVTTQDPVATGLVDSVARPGGNITGLTRFTRELSGNRLELLNEVIPRVSRVGVLWDGGGVALKEYQAAAPALKIQLQSLEVRGPNPDLEGAFQAATKGNVSAVITAITSVLVVHTKKIADLALNNRLL